MPSKLTSLIIKPETDSIRRLQWTWNEADNVCRSMGGTLPILNSRDELDDLISLIKITPDIPLVEALYLGLKWSAEVCYVRFRN